MVEKMLFKHPAPLLNDVHQCVLEGSNVQLQPATEHLLVLHLAHLHIKRLKEIDLGGGTTHSV